MAWAAEQELQAVSRRTRAGLEKARAEGKTLGPPRIVDDDQVEAMARAQAGRTEPSVYRKAFRSITHHGAAATAGSCES